MNSRELAFIIMTVGSYVITLISIGFGSDRWSEVEFVFVFFSCVLVFIQFLIRYLAITHIYKTENSIGAWVVSLLIFATSLIMVAASLRIPIWFLVFGLLLLLAALKNMQSRKRIMEKRKPDVERTLRLREYMVFELAFGVLMILFWVFAKWGLHIHQQLSPAPTIFFGSLFAAFYAFVSTLIMVMRMFTNRRVIERHMKELDVPVPRGS